MKKKNRKNQMPEIEEIPSNLKLAIELSFQEWLDSLPNEEDLPKIEYSERHKRQMAILFDKMRGDRYHRFTRKTTAVLITIAIIFSLSITTVAIVKIAPYIIKEFNDHAIFQTESESDEKVNGNLECAYVPDEYELVNKHASDGYCLQTYNYSDDKHFSVFKVQNGNEMGFDNEDSQKTVYNTENMEYVVYEKDNGNIQVVWCDENYTYRIDGNIPCDLALKIAENVK